MQIARPIRPARAFTLIELILVMAILTVAVGLTAPSLAKFFRGRALNSEARRMLSLVRYGQERAASEGLPMELWVDASSRKFGLAADPSYEDTDSKEVEFTLDENLRVETVAATTVPRTTTLTTQRSSSSRTQVQGKHAAFPAIRFMPDGTVAETSPSAIRLSEDEGFTMSIVQSRNRLGYEIAKDNR